MNHFSIKDIEALTGIKPHTIRIWEQRYHLVEPKRTQTNIRYYDDNDLKNLLNISLLNKNGYKISKISKLSKAEIDRIIVEECASCTKFHNQVHALMGCMLNLDEAGFQNILSTSIKNSGLRTTMTEIIFPFLHHIGLLWMVGTVNTAFEHFVTNIIKTKLFSAIDQLGINPKSKGAKKFLLFLPQGETHAIGLLFGNYLIRQAGHHSLYLGQSMPETEVDQVIRIFKPKYILTSIVSGMTQSGIQEWIDGFSSRHPRIQILVTGNGFVNNPIRLPKNVILIRTPVCMDDILSA